MIASKILKIHNHHILHFKAKKIHYYLMKEKTNITKLKSTIILCILHGSSNFNMIFVGYPDILEKANA